MNKRNKIFDTVRSLFFFPLIYYRIKRNRSSIFFVFPSWQIGGSERVHVDIIALFNTDSELPMCIITEPQKKGGLFLEFKKYANINYIWRWGIKKSFKPLMAKILAQAINKRHNPSVLGSNNRFFYDLIPYLKEHVRIIDLTHSITPKRNWCEVYSLPYVNRISARVVLGQNSIDAFRTIYEENHIPREYLSRFKIIHNKVSIPAYVPTRSSAEELHVLFVARNSPEKRLHLIFRIINQCLDSNLPVKFTLISNIENCNTPYNQKKVTIRGLIADKVLLSQYYSAAHLILIASSFEGFPMVLAEGMAHGLVPVATAVGEISQFVSENQQTGFLIANQQDEDQIVNGFVQAIATCIANRDMVTEFSKKARAQAEDNFSLEKFRQSYRKLILEGE